MPKKTIQDQLDYLEANVPRIQALGTQIQSLIDNFTRESDIQVDSVDIVSVRELVGQIYYKVSIKASCIKYAEDADNRVRYIRSTYDEGRLSIETDIVS